jgi:hypothetical protein
VNPHPTHAHPHPPDWLFNLILGLPASPNLIQPDQCPFTCTGVIASAVVSQPDANPDHSLSFMYLHLLCVFIYLTHRFCGSDVNLLG